MAKLLRSFQGMRSLSGTDAGSVVLRQINHGMQGRQSSRSAERRYATGRRGSPPAQNGLPLVPLRRKDEHLAHAVRARLACQPRNATQVGHQALWLGTRAHNVNTTALNADDSRPHASQSATEQAGKATQHPAARTASQDKRTHRRGALRRARRRRRGVRPGTAAAGTK